MNPFSFFAAVSTDDPLWVQLVPEDRELEFFRDPVAWVQQYQDADFPKTFVISLQGPLDSVDTGFLLQGIAGTNVLAIRPTTAGLFRLKTALSAYQTRAFPVKHDFHVYIEDHYAATHTEIFPAGLDPDARAEAIRNHLFATASDPAVLHNRMQGRNVLEHTRMSGSYGAGTLSRAYTIRPITSLDGINILYTSTQGSDAQACEAIYAGLDLTNPNQPVIVVQTALTKDYLVKIPPDFREALERQAPA